MSADLTLADARADRDRLADRTDVLDKVGALRMLPGNTYVTTAAAAGFYGVDVDTVYQVVKRNRDELDCDGYRVIARSEVTDTLSVTPDDLGMPRTAPSIALFPRRAILRVGMLLRDSPVAQQVRTYLLDTEQDQAPAFLIPKTLPAALRLAADQYERAELAEQQAKMLTAKIEHDAPKIAKAEAHSTSDSDIHRQAFSREVQQWGKTIGVTIMQEQVYEVLRRKGMLVAGQRSDRNHATAHAVSSGWARTVKGVSGDGHAYATTKILARGQDIAWKWITEHVKVHGDLRMDRAS